MRFRLFAVAFLILSALQGCDTTQSPEPLSDQVVAEAAKSWYESETGLSAFSRTNARTASTSRLTDFYPDWESGEVIAGPDGSHISVTRLWRDANVRYDTSVFLLRVLAVYLHPDGSVDRAAILNFVSPNTITETDGPELVASLARGSLGSRDVVVMEFDVSYDLSSTRHYAPDGTVTDIEVTTVETSTLEPQGGADGGSVSARGAVSWTCFTMSVEYRVDVGYREGIWRTDTWPECYDSGYDGDGDHGGDEGYNGGSGSGGGGAPGDSGGDEDDSSQDPWPRIHAAKVHELYGKCDNISSAPKDHEQRNLAFEANVVESFGASQDTRSSNSLPGGYQPLDGFETHNGYIAQIYEVKNVKKGNYAFNNDDAVLQATSHIDRLVEHREALRDLAAGADWILELGAPTYTVITTSDLAPDLDYHGRILAHARSKGVNLEVYFLRERGFVDWYLDGYRLNGVGGSFNEWYTGISYGAVPEWARWLLPGHELENAGFAADCEPSPNRARAPDPPQANRVVS